MPGVEFAVWAPNAQRVSVVGTFDAWDGRRHPMQRVAACGVWELFVPGVGPGDLYKYEIKTPDGAVFLKSDPSVAAEGCTYVELPAPADGRASASLFAFGPPPSLRRKI